MANPTDHRDPYPPLYTVRLPLDVADGLATTVYLDVHADWLEVADRDASS